MIINIFKSYLRVIILLLSGFLCLYSERQAFANDLNDSQNDLNQNEFGSNESKKGSVLLQKLNDTLYYTENALFVCGDKLHAGFPEYDKIFNNSALVDWCTSNFIKYFPNKYLCLTIAANGLTPNWTPRWINSRKDIPDGINFGSMKTKDFDVCYYNIGGGSVQSSWPGVFDHEIGHAFGIRMEPAEGHWPENGTVHDQMGGYHYAVSDYSIARYFEGDPLSGFRWKEIDNIIRNWTEIYSENTLYAMGLSNNYPDIYQLNNFIDNPDGTVSYSDCKKYDLQSMVSKYGERVPSYIESPKKFNIGFIYIARDLNEINTVYEGFENGIRFYSNSDTINTVSGYWSVIPFFAATRSRASANSRIANLDGNHPPEIVLSQEYFLTQKNTTVNIPFSYTDPENDNIKLSFYGKNVSISNNQLVVGPLPDAGTFYYSVRAADPGGKTCYAHFIVDVEDIITGPSIPVLVSPANSSIKITQKHPLLHWNNDSPASTFHLQVSLNPEFSNIIFDNNKVIGTSISIGELDINTVYFWRVRSTNPTGTSNWSLTWNFKTVTTDPEKPVLMVPEDGGLYVSIINPYFRWDPTTGASTFRVQISKDQSFSVIVFDQADINESQIVPYSLSLSPGTKYYWRVNAKNDIGASGPWSEIRSFTTESPLGIETGKQDAMFSLKQNYPNPFSDQTTIEFFIPGSCEVEISIYNISGMRIAFWLRKFQEGGLYAQDWIPPAYLEEGLYFYQLRTRSNQWVKKMIYNKNNSYR